MDELGPDEQKWLDVLRVADEPTTQDRARVWGAVATITGAGAGAGAGAAAAGAGGIAKSGAVVKATSAATTLTFGWKVGLAVVAIGVAGAGAAIGFAGREAPEVAVTNTAAAQAHPAAAVVDERPLASAPLPAEGAPLPAEGASLSAEGAPLPADEGASLSADEGAASPAPAVRSNEPITPPAPKATARVAAPRPSQPRPADVEAELALLTQAQRALERGDANGALTALGRHGREHPHGALSVEREGLRAIASCEARRAEGRALAHRFVAQNPTSPLVARVNRACLSP